MAGAQRQTPGATFLRQPVHRLTCDCHSYVQPYGLHFSGKRIRMVQELISNDTKVPARIQSRTCLTLCLATMVSATALLGVVLLARHGDRLEFFQDPLTYNPTQTFLTPLGSVQEQQLGTFLRNTYIDPGSPTAIEGINSDVVNITQLIVRADAGGGGSVILTSVQGLLQGLYPPTTDNNITLANGIESVEPNLDISLNSFTSCPNFDNHTAQFYASPEFQAEAAMAQPFLEQLQPYLDNRSINFTNMVRPRVPFGVPLALPLTSLDPIISSISSTM
ncbi:hypothetical protein NUW54_g9352 [Trametes sanguinea]|uniref:Uncharacterized protein n=1 Tax=Trametes sanguinea TaxID=158606 RepID=A0ACC1P6T9_9APHY|nr:hypothetical protein NUW54_g9352 [Trametes sanguinea]